MWRLFTMLGVLAISGVLGGQRASAAPQSPRPAAVGPASDANSLVWLPPAEIADKAPIKDETTGSIAKECGGARGPATIDAAAFEKLRAEVAALHSAIEALPASVHESRKMVGGARTVHVERRVAVVENHRASRSSAPRP
jgi:hypothetical protein